MDLIRNYLMYNDNNNEVKLLDKSGRSYDYTERQESNSLPDLNDENLLQDLKNIINP